MVGGKSCVVTAWLCELHLTARRRTGWVADPFSNVT